jgi:hypothetical protein
MMNVIQFENSEYVRQCVNVVAFVRKVLFWKRMVIVLNLKLVARQSKDYIKHVV